MIANKKKAFIWWAYFFYLLFLWLWFMIFHDRMKNWEVLTYLTYSNNNRKQKNTFIWWMYFSCWWLLWLCFIIFHDRSKNEEVLAYLTYSNNDRKQKKTLSSDERIFSICNFYGCDSWYSMTEWKTEKW